jgi:hypothetical protein
LADVPHARIGEVTEEGLLAVTGLKGDVVIYADIARLKAAWKKPLAW